MRLALRDGVLALSGLQNRTSQVAREYAPGSGAGAPFALGVQSSGGWSVTAIRQELLAPGSAAVGMDLAATPVKKGELVGFAAGTRSDDAGGSVSWAPTVRYVDGEAYSPADAAGMEVGPIWFYHTWAAGTGCMEPLSEVVPGPEPARVPGGYRAPFECSRVTAGGFALVNSLDLVRVWKAPRDGVVTITGEARHSGGASVTVSLLRIAEHPPTATNGPGWQVDGVSARRVAVGGRPAVQLDLALSRNGLRSVLHIQAYPGTAILRQWVDVTNATGADVTLEGAAPIRLPFDCGPTTQVTHYWMCGGTSRPNQGELGAGDVGQEYHRSLLGDRSDNYVPWMALLHGGARQDGIFVAMDHLGAWSMAVDAHGGATTASAGLPELAGHLLRKGTSLRLPTVTLGVFSHDLDDMGRRVYDWQYEYLWDFANSDYFARTKWAVPWFFCSRNLQEQFAARLAGLDMDADLMRTMGFEMLWDDAGWSKYPGWPIPDNYGVVFTPSNEGPDYAETLRYLGKMGMRWILWFAGRPSAGVMDTKVGSWGDFQWRTDGFGRFGVEGDRAIRGQFERYLLANPGSSFHTCDGGSRYAHQFEVQRYADVNYLSDLGRDAKTNHYLSYIDLPDKWCDIIDPLTEGGKYNPDIAWGQLSMVPGWYAQTVETDREKVRHLMEVYRYLRREKVVGRWSYMMHPRVVGDGDFYYDQRMSHDRLRACIVLKHRVPGPTVVIPKGLIPSERYTMTGRSQARSVERTGADLMEHGIALEAGTPGGIIALGLPNLPGIGADRSAPTAPGRALMRCETQLGHIGVAIYWSPGSDGSWISAYEVRRGAEVIGKASVGTFYFDHSPGWSEAAAYAVRTVDGDGNRSGWTAAVSIGGGQECYASLGGHFANAGREGWSAEARLAGGQVKPMRFVPPARNPAGDLGGTPNQPGGVEGYWEGEGLARVGRGWQQASPGEQCVRVWTVPRAGTVRVVGRAMKECYRQSMGSALRVRIELGNRQVWPDAGWAEVRPGDWRGAEHDLSLTVSQGEAVRFVLDRGLSPDDDIIAWMPRISYPQPPLVHSGTVARILCGASRGMTDRYGVTWSADHWFTGGRVGRTRAAAVAPGPTPCDPASLVTRREGRDFSYAIPVAEGLYSVRVRFAEPTRKWSFERPICLQINGQAVFEDFDICHAARGAGAVCERVVRNVVPDGDGHIRLRFTGGFSPLATTGEAMVNSIEVLPETGDPVRISVGAGKPFVDWNSYRWEADRGGEGGVILQSNAWTAQASPTLYDQALYQSARSGRAVTYRVPVRPGHYSVHLKLAELWLPKAGGRPMDIDINGHRVRANWDPAQAAGQVGMAADIRVPGVTPDGQGVITIRVAACGVNDAIIQAIEIE